MGNGFEGERDGKPKDREALERKLSGLSLQAVIALIDDAVVEQRHPGEWISLLQGLFQTILRGWTNYAAWRQIDLSA